MSVLAHMDSAKRLTYWDKLAGLEIRKDRVDAVLALLREDVISLAEARAILGMDWDIKEFDNGEK